MERTVGAGGFAVLAGFVVTVPCRKEPLSLVPGPDPGPVEPLVVEALEDKPRLQSSAEGEWVIV
jgi:hypothetical protein